MRLLQAVFTISVAVVTGSPAVISAKTDEIYANYKYVMGDNDTKSDAKRIAFIEAKRRVMEKVGVFVSLDTEVSNFQLTKDQIRSYTAAILQVEVVSEKVSVEDETMTMFIVVKAKVDVAEVRKNIKKIQEDNVLRKKVEAQQRKILELENRYRDIQKKLAESDYNEGTELRKERRVVYGELYEFTKRQMELRERELDIATRPEPPKENIDEAAYAEAKESWENTTQGWMIGSASFGTIAVVLMLDAGDANTELEECENAGVSNCEDERSELKTKTNQFWIAAIAAVVMAVVHDNANQNPPNRNDFLLSLVPSSPTRLDDGIKLAVTFRW